MVGHGGSSAGSYLADPTSPIPSHCASIVETSTVRVNLIQNILAEVLPRHQSWSSALSQGRYMIRDHSYKDPVLFIISFFFFGNHPQISWFWNFHNFPGMMQTIQTSKSSKLVPYLAPVAIRFTNAIEKNDRT